MNLYDKLTPSTLHIHNKSTLIWFQAPWSKCSVQTRVKTGQWVTKLCIVKRHTQGPMETCWCKDRQHCVLTPLFSHAHFRMQEVAELRAVKDWTTQCRVTKVHLGLRCCGVVSTTESHLGSFATAGLRINQLLNKNKHAAGQRQIG